MSDMFYNATAFDQPLTFNTGNVTNMYRMFENATAFDQPLNFDTSSVTRMDLMFKYATSFDQPLTFNTSSVTDMSNMFNNASSFNRALTFNDTSSVTNMSRMFYNTSFDQAITFDITSVTNMVGMFDSIYNTLSTANYDSILINWKNQLQTAYPNGTGYTPVISITFGGSQYTGGGSSAEISRNDLINTFNWTIIDGGVA